MKHYILLSAISIVSIVWFIFVLRLLGMGVAVMTGDPLTISESIVSGLVILIFAGLLIFAINKIVEKNLPD